MSVICATCLFPCYQLYDYTNRNNYSVNHWIVRIYHTVFHYSFLGSLMCYRSFQINIDHAESCTSWFRELLFCHAQFVSTYSIHHASMPLLAKFKYDIGRKNAPYGMGLMSLTQLVYNTAGRSQLVILMRRNAVVRLYESEVGPSFSASSHW